LQHIESPHNQRVKLAVRLRSPRGRQQQQRIVVDGIRETTRALQSSLEITELFICEELVNALDLHEIQNAALKHPDATLFSLPKSLFKKLAFGDRTDGIVAIAKRPATRLADLPEPDNALIAVLESFEKPGNLGAVLRSADGAGIDAVMIASPLTDVFHPNAIRNSTACLFHMPIAVDSTENCYQWLQERKIKCVAATPQATRFYYDADFTGNTAIILGNEARGLSPRWLCDEIPGFRIPMVGCADSLNVSSAATAIFYEAHRQRHQQK
jgi:RNA methyltransferase, TrmH family